MSITFSDKEFCLYLKWLLYGYPLWIARMSDAAGPSHIAEGRVLMFLKFYDVFKLFYVAQEEKLPVPLSLTSS